jgi:hypothetical protein
MRTGGLCGLLGIAAYLAAAFAPLPDVLGYAAAFAFGPLLALGAIGLYHALAFERRTPLLQTAVVFAVGAGFTVLIMLTTQQAIFGVMKDVAARNAGVLDAAQTTSLGTLKEGLNAVHFGIDVAWDVLISVAVILFAAAMLGHPKFGRILGGLGIVLGALLLGYNLWYFPVPPASAHSVDWGPFVALWLLVTFALLLRVPKWVRS